MEEMMITYSIGEVAEKFNLSLPTIRYYDKEGLIPNLRKNDAGVRRFTQENLGSLQMIECLKNAGMPIRDIKQFMQWTLEGNASLEKRYKMFQELRVNVLKQMEAMQNTLNTIDFKCKYYGQATSDGTEKYVKEDMHLEIS
ncbi:transcriptional regulator [Companilactobacillus crustorum]|uniref:Transcriptional regulator n=3 Tax=Companilactobacillus TaxID=2767879 RepID=A0A837RJI4_9LACO|nr:transcriptional regulator [Companilactobacillus crustorum JCM 15951]KRO20243.1 transcriptional regulator [Companilactobacillus crustorum]GEO76677.1 transcriptional regulator [Companilactobacillus crustorum]